MNAIEIRRVYWRRMANAAEAVGGAPPDPSLYERPMPRRRVIEMAVGLGAAVCIKHDPLIDLFTMALTEEMMDDILRLATKKDPT